MSSAPETQFGKYVLIDRIAAGGMAEIYKARYEPAAGVTKVVVIKKILPHFAENKAFISMFTNEARIAMGLSHGNIAQVFDFGAINNEYFIAMEYVDGQPLSGLLRRARAMGLAQLPAEVGVFITSRILKGLNSAHAHVDEQGRPMHIVHRDVSPQNVLLSYSGQVKLVDFGIAKARTAGTKDDTSTSAVKGKYAYFSPEQARSKELDARTDIFATGIILYELLTGQLPFPGRMMDTLSRIVRGIFPRPREVNPSVPPEIETVILKSMAPEKADRYQSADDFAQVLSEWLSKEHPTFSSGHLGSLLQLAFEEVLAKEGRPVQLPSEFLERVERWRAAAPAHVTEQNPTDLHSSSAGRGDSDLYEDATEAVEVPKGAAPEREAEGTEAPTHLVSIPPEPIEPSAPGPASPARRASPPPAQAETGGALTPVNIAPGPAPGAPASAPTKPLPSPEAETDAAEPVTDEPDPAGSDPRAGRRRLPLWQGALLLLGAIAVGFGAVVVMARSSLGTLEVQSVPAGAFVRVQGTGVSGPAPVTLRDLEGDRTYRVEVTAPGFVDWRNDVPLKRGQRVVVRAELTPTPSPPPPPVVTTSAGEPPPPPAPVPDAVALPLETFELEAGRHHVDLAQAGVNHVTLDPTETYRVWLGKGPTLGWGYYVLNPAGAQPGALGAKALEMKGATNLYLFRVGADTLGSGPDETKPRQLYLQNVRRKKSSTEVVAGSLEIPASSRVTVSGLDERLTYELLVSPGEPPARRREDGRAISSVVVGHPSDGLLVANLSAPLRLTRTTRFWLTLLDDEPAEGLEGRLSLTLRAVAAVQSHAPK